MNVRNVSPDYFRDHGHPPRGGAGAHVDDDGADGVRSVVVNEKLAARSGPERARSGGGVKRSRGASPTWEIVGVARDVHFERLDRDPEPLIYMPLVTGGADGPRGVRALAVVLHVGADP